MAVEDVLKEICKEFGGEVNENKYTKNIICTLDEESDFLNFVKELSNMRDELFEDSNWSVTARYVPDLDPRYEENVHFNKDNSYILVNFTESEPLDSFWEWVEEDYPDLDYDTSFVSFNTAIENSGFSTISNEAEIECGVETNSLYDSIDFECEAVKNIDNPEYIEDDLDELATVVSKLTEDLKDNFYDDFFGELEE